MSKHKRIDVRAFFQATNPDRALFLGDSEEDNSFYIDLSDVRGGKVIEEIEQVITFFSPDLPG